jgi:hypothetical protein
MDYDAIAAHFLTPPAVPVPAPAVPDSAARRLRDALEPIATIGWWSRAAGEGFAVLGIDFFGGYVWGRAAALGGDVAPSVVVGAFGVFEANLLTAVLAGAQAVASQDAVLAQRASGATQGLAAATSTIDVATIESLATRLLAATDKLDEAGRPLFSGLRALPTPSEPHGRLWRAAELIREHRGDGHLAACVAVGLRPIEMNVITELWLDYPLGEYSSTRGFSPEQLAIAATRLQGLGWLDSDNNITASGREARDAIEHATDRSQRCLIEAIGDDVEAVVASASIVSDAVMATHAAPADARKRAAG